ncbi:MAG: hypothetical protein LH679_24270, partial [Cyanobacteria bacterium CAN_BIN43]|nr:hypothetical protein [Cyanobacteria bacterium CAN_BIN43]
GAARVLFITTSDTVVPAETIMKGTNLKVGVWQAIVCTNLQPGGLLQVGPATPLNPELYRTGTLFYGQPGVLNDLAKPGGSPAGYEDMDGGLTGP